MLCIISLLYPRANRQMSKTRANSDKIGAFVIIANAKLLRFQVAMSIKCLSGVELTFDD